MFENFTNVAYNTDRDGDTHEASRAFSRFTKTPIPPILSK